MSKKEVTQMEVFVAGLRMIRRLQEDMLELLHGEGGLLENGENLQKQINGLAATVEELKNNALINKSVH